MRHLVKAVGRGHRPDLQRREERIKTRVAGHGIPYAQSRRPDTTMTRGTGELKRVRMHSLGSAS
jgi:hypothetical protein